MTLGAKREHVILLLGTAAIAENLACATWSSTRDVESRTVISSREEVDRRLGAIRVERLDWPSKDELEIHLFQEERCRRVRADRVSKRVIHERESESLSLDLVGGFLFAGGGSLALGLAGELSSAEPLDGGLSPQGNAYLWGGLSAVSGVVLLIHGLYIAGQSIDRSEPPVEVVDRSPISSEETCGKTSPRAGAIFARRGEYSLAIQEHAEGSPLRLQLRPALESWCNSLDVGPEEVARLFYRPGNNRQKEIHIADYSLAHCVHAARTRRALQQANDTFAATTTGAELIKGTALLRDATSDLLTLAADDPERAELEAERARITNRAQTLAAGIVDQEVARAVLEIDRAADLARAIELAVETLAAANLAPLLPERIWQRIYGALIKRFTRREISTTHAYDALEEVIAQDLPTRLCLEEHRADGCPSWLSEDLIVKTWAPVIDAYGREIIAAASRLTSSTATVDRAPNLRSVEAFEASQVIGEALADRCQSKSRRIRELAPACDGLGQALGNAEEVKKRRAEAIEKAHEAARAEAAKRETAIAIRSWRTHFAACRRLSSALKQVNRLYRNAQCGAPCMQAIQKMRDEYERLAAFQVDSVIEDESVLGQLRGECLQASCDSCP